MGLIFTLEHQGRNYGVDVTEIGLVIETNMADRQFALRQYENNDII